MYFWKIIFQTKNTQVRRTLTLCFCRPPWRPLRRRQLDFLSGFCIQSPVMCWFGWSIEAKADFTQICYWKGKVSSLLLCQNTRKVGSIVESETISVSFSFRLKSTSLSYTLNGCHVLVSEGNGTPLQYSCLENHGRRSLVGCSPWGR